MSETEGHSVVAREQAELRATSPDYQPSSPVIHGKAEEEPVQSVIEEPVQFVIVKPKPQVSVPVDDSIVNDKYLYYMSCQVDDHPPTCTCSKRTSYRLAEGCTVRPGFLQEMCASMGHKNPACKCPVTDAHPGSYHVKVKCTLKGWHPISWCKQQATATKLQPKPILEVIPTQDGAPVTKKEFARSYQLRPRCKGPPGCKFNPEGYCMYCHWYDSRRKRCQTHRLKVVNWSQGIGCCVECTRYARFPICHDKSQPRHQFVRKDWDNDGNPIMRCAVCSCSQTLSKLIRVSVHETTYASLKLLKRLTDPWTSAYLD